MRIILYTGKGGVGKTTLSTMAAVQTAKLGHRTLVISTDPAHNLSDSFDMEVGGKPKKIRENLWAQEVDVQREMEENWRIIKDHMTPFLESKGARGIVAEELAVLPGFEEVFSLLEIQEHVAGKKYDVIILDSAPTGSALRLLSFPEVMGWWTKNIFGMVKLERELKAVQSLTPFAARFLPGMREVDILTTLKSVKELHGKISKLKTILQDNKITTVRLVVNLEKMVIEEAKRAYMYLNFFGIAVDSIFVNRVLPDELQSPYFKKWKEIQKKYYGLVGESFRPLPVMQVPYLKDEPVGLSHLDNVASMVYKDTDPSKIYYKGCPMKFERKGETLKVSLHLPFVKKEDLEVIKRKDELILKFGGYKHSLALPQSYQKHDIIEAKFQGEELDVYFKKGSDGEKQNAKQLSGRR